MNQIYQTKGMKFISVIMGLILGGMMWRVRGESGFGSSWGLYCVGLVIMLVIYLFYGNRQGMKYEAIPFGAFLLGLGVTGYASVIEQPAGVIDSFVPFMGEEDAYRLVDYRSGLLIFAIMAFTFVPLFAFFVGSLFSDKKYTAKSYIIIILVFFGAGYLFKATVAHPILSLINPDQVDLAYDGLKDAGFGDMTPAVAYMKHFAQKSWCDDIPFFENYYMSIEHISDALAIIVDIIVIRIAFKDRVTALSGLFVNLITSVGSTFCVVMNDWFVTRTFGTNGYGSKLGVFENIITRCDWGTWEYSTGAFFGLSVMLLIALLPKKYTALTQYDITPLTDNKIVNFGANLVLAVFIFSLTPARAIGMRVGKLLNYYGIINNYHLVSEPLMIGLTVILAVGFFLMFRKNLFIRGVHITGTDPVSFSKVALPSFLTLCFVLYLFTNKAPLLDFLFEDETVYNGLIDKFFSLRHNNLALVIISFVIGMVLFLAVKIKTGECKEKK